ncbi:glycosyltransferase [Janibacter massiliensis]|uniref:glycosyltransferase n=1 Tax=Janibacter massiliensis TaxID=2058291 RepID=UPI000D0F5EC2|nr:glycosyltransferase [Janibacter massiliensis]
MSATAIVVTYNHAPYVRQCLESIRQQTRPFARLLLIDDRSPDDTVAVVKEWIAETGFEVEVHVNPENRGLTKSLNAGLGDVRTPFYAYISGDDYMFPDRVERQLEVLEQAPADVVMVYSDAHRVDADDRRLPDFSDAYGWPGGLDPEATYLALLRDNWIPAPSVMLRTDAVRAAGGYDEDQFYEDWDLWLRLARQFVLARLDEPLVAFRELETSLGHTQFHARNPRFLEARAATLRKHLGPSETVRNITAPLLWETTRRRWFLGARPSELREDVDSVQKNLTTRGQRVAATFIHLGVPGPPLEPVVRAARALRAGARR